MLDCSVANDPAESLRPHPLTSGARPAGITCMTGPTGSEEYARAWQTLSAAMRAR